MISAVFILDRSGEILCLRKYRNDFNKTVVDDYRINYVAANELSSPATFYNGFSFLHHYQDELYYVAMTRENANAGVIFQFLSKLPDVFSAIIPLTEVNRDNIKQNAPEILELLEEMIDSGYIQTTDVGSLRLLTHRRPRSVKVPISNEQVTIMATGAVSWRPQNVYYKNNEIFVEVGEKVTTLISPSGKILDSLVNGNIVLKVYLSGMPECKIGFNDKVTIDTEHKKGVPVVGTTSGIEVDDMVFHQCVKLTNFAQDRAITFIPPDGEFELMKYRKTSNIKVPFQITPMLHDLPGGNTEVKVIVKSTYDQQLTAHPFLLSIPMPDNAAKVKIASSIGVAKFVGSKNAVIWKVSRFPGQTQAEISCLVNCLASVKKESAATKITEPISAEFSIVMFSASGLSLRYMTIVEKSNYPMDRWIRYTTRAGKYEIRIV
ncbi:Adaptor complexes medium subunit family protein [Tritrichomonas foetus]|uniref:Adaptor complexes medium subunit family protein n=1 Tax=Tritrichomonas foetus TaxID=1144522 RepID=A0A1J4K0I9_9EUKA|nr:Adaptor complexes medium subunit family protein [Tritrichomonas foetus]|eukprot:OHT03262.1 Adaptor complexes medium subunit family protein [Tritrichomonas foetus]